MPWSNRRSAQIALRTPSFGDSCRFCRAFHASCWATMAIRMPRLHRSFRRCGAHSYGSASSRCTMFCLVRPGRTPPCLCVCTQLPLCATYRRHTASRPLPLTPLFGAPPTKTRSSHTPSTTPCRQIRRQTCGSGPSCTMPHAAAHGACWTSPAAQAGGARRRLDGRVSRQALHGRTRSQS